MATSYKNIVITPNISNTSDPKIQFSGANSSVNTDITMYVYPTSNGTLSFEGSAGQLFSITNDLSNLIFSVTDVSGIPSMEVYANGLVTLIPVSGNVVFGNSAIIANSAALKVNVPLTANIAQSNFSNTAVEGHIELPYGNFIYELYGINNKLNVNDSTAAFRVKANTDVELFTVVANGFVGVGNTTPAHKLRVEGTLSLSDGIQANGSLGTSGDVLTSNGTSVYWTAAGGGTYMKGGTSTIGSLATEGQNIFRVNANTLNNDTTIATGENAQATGPLTVASGKTLTIQTGARVSIV